ncbi:AAA family ATPase [Gilliamella apis]|uniref:AAA family ATPase n=1 Tax=Gilliamella apis TaxID=1970738 RepID=UPI00080EE087|nr:AAA family ATPase [Gilliamella apis]OCG02801.1 recombinase RecF [Gilliamella apis]
MNWKISRIEVSSFKAFKHIILDLGASSLVTLDGPNGYGKTSIFDAIELLLTGQIKRIENLFSTLMTKNQTNYNDNLFWNTRSGEKDLSIKIEFIDGKRSLVLARHAPVKTFKTKANNRADKFEHFSLYKLPNFDSKAYTEANKRELEFLDKTFGENFRENFSFLNYLEQGQNALLHTRIDDRRNKLGNLFNTSDIATEIENCHKIEKKLTKLLKDKERQANLENLNKEYTEMRKMVQADLGTVEYRKLSTIEPEPFWDKEEPFPTYDREIFCQFLEFIQRLEELLPQKAAIRIRAKNEAIEASIEQYAESLIYLAKLGTDRNKLDELDKTRKEIDQLVHASAIIKNGASVITTDQARSLPSWTTDRLEWFETQITERNDLQKTSVTNNNTIAELAHLKQQLLDEHAKLYPDDQICPLCGNDWNSHTSMLKAIEDRTTKINDTLNLHGKRLVSMITLMTTELANIDSYIQGRKAILQSQYNNSLHNTLKEAKTRLPEIQQLAERLKTEGIPITFTFSDDETVWNPRLEKLRNLMRAKKTNELMLPSENWRQIINTVFKDIQDFYILDPKDLKNKKLYITIKANEAQNSKLQTYLKEIERIEGENKAINRAKYKVNKLRNTLKTAEQKYTNQTISEIELIFHIYSGRLIQNYQRGLGLFIDSGDGKQLKFLTAEKSDHDAIMSMSSGQVSALGLAFFLSLNKVYAKFPLILIDDPSQSLDEVNIASLTDLLRCELKHCQLIVSSHEEDISAYMRYRFNRAELTTNSLNMQRLAKEAL